MMLQQKQSPPQNLLQYLLIFVVLPKISPVSSWFLSSLDQHRPNFHISFFAQVQNNTKLLENLAFRSLHAPIRVQSFPPMHGKPVNVFRVTILARSEEHTSELQSRPH